MQAPALPERTDLSPPRPPARLRSVTLAVLAHVALLAALTWGVHWKRSSDAPAVEAELWAATPQEAAPAATSPTPAPPPPPVPVPPPPPPPAPAPAPPPPPVAQAPAAQDADIAIEREKQRLEKERQRLQKQLEQEKRERLQAEKDKQERLEKQREKEQAQAAEKARQQKLAEDKRKQQEANTRKAQDDARRVEALRQDNLRRMQALAGATGGPAATGTAQQSSGPSGSYGGKVVAKVKPNITFTDDVAGNPTTEVTVRAAPDGTITGTSVTKSSGVKAWDEAVVRALQKTETLPRDVDGRVPSSLVITFRPKD
ncbi:TonB family protein [Ramlibacter sp. H39-3-26]|uniref:TonB family protein n=1 Tax=Curvibacter soli TaxID=3031331 RepID=UPI0023D9F806|nr:TonB family protein [Ramlibacter sp. H39-3-26]MDF1483935.1 TonB family protein [Ramlibacter sp. H39-3-26]